MQYTKSASLVPYKIKNVDGLLQCQWLNTYDKPFTEPFFDETISKCRLVNKQYSLPPVLTGLSAIEESATELIANRPAVIIFHISRCGSTLVTQMMATSSRFVVLSEVPMFDQLLRLPLKEPDFDAESVSALLNAAIKHYGIKRNADEKYLVIKTDSWHIFFYKQLRALFPDVPFVLMYRNPAEVLRSQMKMAGMHTVPELVEPELFGFKDDVPDFTKRDVYTAAILEKYLAAYVEVMAAGDKSMLINYSEGPVPIVEKIAGFAGMDITTAEFLEMEERSRYHSKSPKEVFSEEPIKEIPSCLQAAMVLYEKLEEKRKQL